MQSFFVPLAVNISLMHKSSKLLSLIQCFISFDEFDMTTTY